MTPGARAIPRGGAGTSAAGPRTDGSGSIRASACRIGPDGGSNSLSPLRIADCWMSRRSTSELVDWNAIAPTIHAIPSATDAVSAAPSSPSTMRSPGRRKNLRARAPTPSNPLASTAPASSAPSSPNSGAYVECEPAGRTSGASRVPRNAPIPNPSSDRPPTMNPWA